MGIGSTTTASKQYGATEEANGYAIEQAQPAPPTTGAMVYSADAAWAAAAGHRQSNSGVTTQRHGDSKDFYQGY